MEDPVVSEAGISFEKVALEEHYSNQRMAGLAETCPVTAKRRYDRNRPPVRNYALRKLIASWQESLKHGAEGEDYPDAFMCPILHENMKYPAMSRGGHSFEKYALQQQMYLEWEKEQPTRCPVTRIEYNGAPILPNVNLQRAIDGWDSRLKKYIEEKQPCSPKISLIMSTLLSEIRVGIYEAVNSQTCQIAAGWCSFLTKVICFFIAVLAEMCFWLAVGFVLGCLGCDDITRDIFSYNLSLAPMISYAYLNRHSEDNSTYRSRDVSSYSCRFFTCFDRFCIMIGNCLVCPIAVTIGGLCGLACGILAILLEARRYTCQFFAATPTDLTQSPIVTPQ